MRLFIVLFSNCVHTYHMLIDKSNCILLRKSREYICEIWQFKVFNIKSHFRVKYKKDEKLQPTLGLGNVQKHEERQEIEKKSFPLYQT